MTFLERQLAPFVEERQRTGWRGVVWLLLLVLAPAAYVAAIVLGSRLPTAGIRYVTPAAMMERAEQVARERGVDTRGWQRTMISGFQQDLSSYFDDARYRALPAEQKRFASYAVARVVFFHASDGRWLEVRMRADGSVLGIRMAPVLAGEPRTITQEETAQLAREELARVLAPPASLRLTEPEELPGDRGETRRFQWRAEFAGIPEFRGLFIVDVLGDKVTAVREEFSVDRVVLAARTPGWWPIFGTGRGLMAVVFALYGIYRFSRRAMEKEVAYSRCAVLFSAAIVLIGIIMMLNSGLYLAGISVENLTRSSIVTAMIGAALGIGINAILLTLIYGGTEGELREIYAGKLTSLDAFLTGRWFTANVGRAAMIGISVAGWALLAYMLGEHLFPSAVPRMAGSQVNLTYTSHGWLVLVLREPYLAMFFCTFALMLPLTFANHTVAGRRQRVGAIVLLSLGGAFIATDLDQPLPWIFWRAAMVAALMLVSFWRGDFLAAVVAANVFVVGYTVSLLAPLGGDWPGVVRYVVMVAVFTGVVAVGAVYKAREVTDEDVRPKYAERMLERLGLQAEVSAAREAQLRLLPAAVPRLPGWKVAASCTPAKEVGGDFYDFFPLHGGGMGILVAEGGSTGLASALSIGLAKGFLLYAAEKHWTAGESLRRLRPVLLRAVKGNIERLGLAYVTIDGLGMVRVARFGAYPKLIELTPAAAPREVELLGLAEADFVGERSFPLGERSTLVIATDGVVERVRERSGLDLPAWLGQRTLAGATAWHGALLQEAGTDFDDDITVVVVEREAPAVGRREGVA